MTEGVLGLADPMTTGMLEAFERRPDGSLEVATPDTVPAGGLPPLPPGFTLIS